MPGSAEAVEEALAALCRGDVTSALGAYPMAQHAQWLSLTQYVTAASLFRVGMPLGVLVQAGEREKSTPASLKDGEACVPCFPNLSVRRLVGMTASEVTAFNTQPEARLERELSAAGGSGMFLANWQSSFLLFLLIASLPALEHWKAALHLVCNGAGASGWERVAQGMLDTLPAQLSFAPPDFFADADVDSASFLRPALAALINETAAAKSSVSLPSASATLSEFLRETYGDRWMEDDTHVAEEDLTKDAPTPFVSFVDDLEGQRAEPQPQDTVSSATQHERMQWMFPE